MNKEEILCLIKKAIEQLVQNDNDIFKQKRPKIGNSTEKERKLNRELHETTLNHRFAFYLESELISLGIKDYHVDIEYNRNFSNKKIVKIDKDDLPVRPDILIHKRTRVEEKTPHLLVIEAKKGKTSEHDINKIIGFMKDKKYRYEFGLTISYAYNQNEVKAILYYKGKQDAIQKEDIVVTRS